MEVRNCKGCGRLFNYMGGTPLCLECRKKLDEKFSDVKEYIEEHPSASISQVSEEMDVPIKQIKEWVREERLILSEASVDGILCEHCGIPICSGRYCDKCKMEMANAFQNVLGKKGVAVSKPERHKIDERDKMRFLR